MLPHYNSYAHLSNQVHTTGGSSATPHQLVMPSNPSLAISGNMLQFSMQMQPQLGMSNPQIPIPFSNSNTHLSNGHGVAMPNMPPSMMAQPNFMNLPHNLLPMQNNHLGMPQFGSAAPPSQPGQPRPGFFSPQNNAYNMNSGASFPVHRQFCNLLQSVNQVNQNMGLPPGQLLGHTQLNFPQQMNQNMGLPYGQFSLPNLMQNMNQVVPMQMQMQNPSQVGPNFAFVGTNQVPQATVPQNPSFFPIPQCGNVHSNQVRQQVNQNQKNLVLPTMQGTQGSHLKASGVYNSNPNWKNSPRKSFTKHQKRGVQAQGGFQNSRFHHMKNAKGKFAFHNGHKGKGLSNESEGKFALADSTNQGRERKRSLSLSYTKQEIQQWREERRKNFPSDANIEKKQREKIIDSEVIEREAKIRREQLKEILSQQAELGVEVAEIPSYYLSDSKKQGHGREENRSFTKNGRLPNKFGKRERYDKKDRFSKRQRPHHKDSSNNDQSFSKREPTLLQKLLSADIRRDKSRLLQVFRFMVTNSFFKDCPDKPLEFPTVVVKESGCEKDVVEELSSLAGKDAFEGSDKSMIERDDNNDYGKYDDDDGGEDDDEEEGEIIN